MSEPDQMHQPNPMRVLAPIHREGWPFVAIFFAVAVALSFLWAPLFWLGLVATLWCAYFFRDPVRVAPEDPALVVSPADGVVVSTIARVPPPELGLGDRPLPCVAVFMNVFDVHVNRAPVPGVVAGHAYHHGTFVNASFDKASDENERQHIVVEGRDGRRIGFTQIAGLVARRILGFVKPGDMVVAGQRIGLIRFGSRVDVYLPDDSVAQVALGQRSIAGETVIARVGGPSVIGIAQ